MSSGGCGARLTPETCGEFPNIPFHKIAGMRNRIVHGYYQVDPGIVWDTCQNDLPGLVQPLQNLLGSSP